ncbi:MAG: transglutaminaseTgpA domain-containing protein [Acidobacteria bacterium]|nr:transglutaminaseTgpA domain-containing protein [Acidobacteriota bacterium]
MSGNLLRGEASEIPTGLRRAYLLVLAPLAALAPIPLFWTEGAVPVALVAYEAALLLLWWRARAGWPVRLSDGFLNAIGLSYFLWLGAEVFLFHPGLLRSVSHLLLFTTIAKLASLKRPGEARTALLVLFLVTLASASSATHVSSLFYFAGMAFLSFRALGRLAILADFEDAPPDRVLRAVPTGGMAVSLLAAAALLTTPLFYSLPRLHSPFVTAPVRVEDALSSALAADRVDLESFGAAKRSDQVVLRMEVSPDRMLPRVLRLREAVFTDYSTGSWTRNPYSRGLRSLHTPRRDSSIPEMRPGDGVAGRISIDLNPFTNGFLFLPYEAVGLDLDRGFPVSLSDGVVRLPSRRRTVRYSAGVRKAEPRGIGATAIDPRVVPPEIRAYAKKLTGDLTDPREIYERIRQHFSKEFVYTLDPRARWDGFLRSRPDAAVRDPLRHLARLLVEARLEPGPRDRVLLRPPDPRLRFVRPGTVSRHRPPVRGVGGGAIRTLQGNLEPGHVPRSRSSSGRDRARGAGEVRARAPPGRPRADAGLPDGAAASFAPPRAPGAVGPPQRGRPPLRRGRSRRGGRRAGRGQGLLRERLWRAGDGKGNRGGVGRQAEAVEENELKRISVIGVSVLTGALFRFPISLTAEYRGRLAPVGRSAPVSHSRSRSDP